MSDLFQSSSFRLAKLFLFAMFAQIIVGCAPEVGSPGWCDSIKDKPAGEMTMNEAKDYAKHCILK